MTDKIEINGKARRVWLVDPRRNRFRRRHRNQDSTHLEFHSSATKANTLMPANSFCKAFHRTSSPTT